MEDTIWDAPKVKEGPQNIVKRTISQQEDWVQLEPTGFNRYDGKHADVSIKVRIMVTDSTCFERQEKQ